MTISRSGSSPSKSASAHLRSAKSVSSTHQRKMGRCLVFELFERHAEELPVNDVNPTVGCRRKGCGKAIDDLRKREIVIPSRLSMRDPERGESTRSLPYHIAEQS